MKAKKIKKADLLKKIENYTDFYFQMTEEDKKNNKKNLKQLQNAVDLLLLTKEILEYKIIN